MDCRLRRTRAFEAELTRRVVDRSEPFPGGTAHFTPSLPEVWDVNFVRFEPVSGVSASALVETVDRLQGDAGLAHRRIIISEETEGDRLAPAFRELGWNVERYLLMLAGTAAGREPSAQVEEVAFERLRELRAALAREAPGGRSAAVVEQLLVSAERHAAAGNARHYAVVVDGRPVAAADLYSDGRTAQIEDVATLEEYRGRGYASAILARAVAAARGTGHDLVFLRADADDWPHVLYQRLGFEPAGAVYSFTRPG